ncbi:HD domain-containing protein [Spirillospora sp. CA-294931]|uniref:HD domain-containing protein n=1 Tax=Spirillospora sp. CA-294931 TaxID=3240042 RepID=UPI003D9150BE
MSSSLPRRAVLGAGAAFALPGGTAHASDLSFPATRLTRAALKLLDRTQSPALRNHSLRSFLFARAATPHRDYDTEVVFLICALHDMGLTKEGSTDHQRFEIDGADFAARFLESRGVTDGRVDTIWDAIALHTSAGFHDSPVFARRRAPEIRIAQRGIGIDLTGPAPLPPGYGDRVNAAHPRLGGLRTLTKAMVDQGLKDPRKAPAMTLPGEIIHQLHPELPYDYWTLDNDWND